MNLKNFPTQTKKAYNTHMDMKKKLDETYLPDKETRKKRLVVGLSGGLNSYVTAYLLKIQKYDLIGVTIQLGWENYKDDASKVLACQMDQPQVDAIRDFCHQLGIPHMVIKSADEFKETVVESWVASKVTGTKGNPCWNCHEMRMRLLHHKMLEVNAQGLATGHLGKLFRQETHHTVYVHTSNDEHFDQSSVLSRLPHEILDKLMLPLSDLQQKEINKLAENFGVKALTRTIQMHQCFDLKNINKEYIPQNVSARYLKPGEVVDGERNQLGDHTGVFQYEYGEVVQTIGHRQNDPLFFSKYSFQEKKIELCRPDNFKRQKIFLTNCKISEETPWIEPLKGVVKISETEFADCWIFPKNISSALIEMEIPHHILEGDFVTILKKKGKNAKVYLTGKARYVQEEHPQSEEGKERVKVDHSRDF
jgi:tRNA-specific 2-thiouridylase